MKKIGQYATSEFPELDDQLLELSKHYEQSMVLQSHDYPDPYGKYQILAAFGAKRLLKSNKDPFEQWEAMLKEKQSWLFGHLNYDLKNDIENLKSEHPKRFNFSQLSFFEPLHLILQRRGEAVIEYWSYEEVQNIDDFLALGSKKEQNSVDKINWQKRQSKAQYIDAVNALKKEINYGNIYEINYCQEFYAEGIEVDVVSLAKALSEKSPMPYGGLYRNGNDYLMCASPERFLCKRESKI